MITICIFHVTRDELLKICLASLKNITVPYKVFLFNQNKEPLNIKDVKVFNVGKKWTTGAAKSFLFDKVETEYMFRLDNDIVVYENALELQLELLEKDDGLGVVSGIRYEGNSIPSYFGVADFELTDDYLIKRKYSRRKVFNGEGDVFYCDFIPVGYSLYRMKVFDDVTMDSYYDTAPSHIDLMYQLYLAGWKCAIHKKSFFSHMKSRSPSSYLKMCRQIKRKIDDNEAHFEKKWNKKCLVKDHKGCFDLHRRRVNIHA